MKQVLVMSTIVSLSALGAGDDVNVPVRPIGPAQPEWNVRARAFMYPPTFLLKDGTGHSLEKDWAKRPVGWVEAKLPDGTGRRFWKKAPFKEGAYPPAVRSYADAAKKAFDWLFESKQFRILRETGDIDRDYPHNCYPSKMVSAAIEAMVHYAEIRPDRRAAALKTAKNGADWLLAHTIAAPSPLAGFPLTYDHHPEAVDKVPAAPARISKERAGISMNIYPCAAALAYLKLYAVVKEPRYLAGARTICDRYIALQGEDGSWWLDQRIADGSPVGTSRVIPADYLIPMFEEAFAATGDARYRAAADRAFASIEKGPLADWNWQGQFEDTPAAPKYQNLTKHPACATALYLLKRFPGDKKRLAQARELLRFSEDQFVFWERPYTPETEPTDVPTRNRPWAGGWFTPSVTEQYSCYRPIDASAAKLICTYLALYGAEHDPLDLAKARALGDTATRMQRSDGFIPTFWLTDAACKGDDWTNCMAATAEALELLAEYDDAVGLGVVAHVTRDEFAERNKAFALMRKAGIDCLRCDFDWRRYRRTKDGPFDWRICDAVVDDAKKAGLSVLPILCNPPDWARPAQDHLGDWRAFVRETARHFKGRIPVYEIWNEENHPGFWPNPNAADYTPVLKAAYEEVKAVDPSARVAIGGTAGCDLGYLECVYKAGGKAFFDIMNVHPYCWPNPPTDGTEGLLGQLKALMARYGDEGKPVWITEMGWPTHKANIPTPGVFTAGLKLARPDQADWRVGCVGVSDDLGALESVVAGIRQLVSPDSTVTAYTADGLNAAVAREELDVVVYPFDESYPLKTIDAVIEFVKKGGILVDFGGCPMYYARVDGKHHEKAADGTLNRAKPFEAFRLGVSGPNAANGLRYNQRFYATDGAQKAGLKYDPEGVRVFRFFDAANLKAGDELIPLLTTKDKNGRDAVGGCVIRYGSDMKGALVLTGSADGRMGSSERQQADNCLKMISVAEQCGVEKLFFYEFRANETDPFYSEDHFGIVHRDLSPKPAYERLAERASRATPRSLFNGL